MPYIIASGVIFAVFVYWAISEQRSFMVLDENISNSMSQIGVQMFSRWEALTSLMDLTKGYAAHEYNALTETVKARSSITKNSSPDDVRKQEDIIAEAMERIITVAARHCGCSLASSVQKS